MKIAILHNQFARGGGMESYLLTLVHGFLERGDRVTVLAREVDQALAGESGCSVRRIRTLLPGRFGKYRFLEICNRRFDRTQYDLSLSLTRTGCQDVAVCGGVHPETIRRIRRTALFRHLHDRMEIRYEARMFARVPWIMAHSRQVAGQITSHYPVKEDKIRVVYPPVDTKRFRPVTGEAVDRVRAGYGIGPERLSLLFVSCGHRCKGLDQLLEAFAGLDSRRFQLLVAGSPIPAGHPDNVRYIGYVDDLAPLYAAVDLTILPSDYEAFGLVVVESLQCGTPVMVSPRVGAAELLSPEDGIVLPDNRPQTLARAIATFPKGFRVRPGFADRHGLGVADHIDTIIRLFTAAP